VWGPLRSPLGWGGGSATPCIMPRCRPSGFASSILSPVPIASYVSLNKKSILPMLKANHTIREARQVIMNIGIQCIDQAVGGVTL
jgi:hypothetical protein